MRYIQLLPNIFMVSIRFTDWLRKINKKYSPDLLYLKI